MSTAFDQAVSQAIAQGLLPANATSANDAEHEDRPWPVILLTALGAWLAAVPLMGVVGLLMGDFITRNGGAYVVGVLLLTGAVVVLRSRSVPLFVEQLAVPALLVGGGSLGLGLYRDLTEGAASGVLAALALTVASLVPRAWLRLLLGAGAAGFVGVALMAAYPYRWYGPVGFQTSWVIAHALLVIWLAALWCQRAVLERASARAAAAVDSISAGWLLLVLAWMAALAGMTFLLGGTLDLGFNVNAGRGVASQWQHPLWIRLASLLVAALGALWLARAWPAARQIAAGLAAAVIVALAWWLPSLGGVLLALALCLTSHRWRLASAAGVAAVWIIGSFYYQLDWPLTTKAMVLVAAGAALAGLSWWMHRASGPAATLAPGLLARPPADRSSWLVALGAFATVAVAGAGIWQKEDVIARGQPVFVALAPVDPRSLMQGDYMQLNFRLPDNVSGAILARPASRRPQVVARKDARGVATLLRIDDGTGLVPGEFSIELTPRNGSWMLVSDAWYFKEGDAKRWSPARFGEFRVAGDGKALLVGMADADLKPIQP